VYRHRHERERLQCVQFDSACRSVPSVFSVPLW
jgi:hypothetical protein